MSRTFCCVVYYWPTLKYSGGRKLRIVAVLMGWELVDKLKSLLTMLTVTAIGVGGGEQHNQPKLLNCLVIVGKMGRKWLTGCDHVDHGNDDKTC